MAMALIFTSFGEPLACRYNVRETGFVDLGTESYRLICFSDSQVAEKQITQLESLAKESLAENSVPFEFVLVDRSSDHPATDYWLPAENPELPSLVLVSPLGHSFWIGPVGEGGVSSGLFRSTLRDIISSPVRSKIAEELATALGVVLVIEGKDGAANRGVRQLVFDAIQTVESELEYFPKPVNRGPVLISLPMDEATSDRFLLWSLNIGTGDLGKPIVVILYGKGRWIGPVMVGEEITFDLVSRLLFIVGADCECGLSPRLIRGTGIPLLWDRRLRNVVAEDLGFDPDNPLVRMEVAKILRIDTWVDYRASENESYVDQLQFPVANRGGTASLERSVTSQLLYLIGGAAALVLGVGALILIWSGRANR